MARRKNTTIRYNRSLPNEILWRCRMRAPDWFFLDHEEKEMERLADKVGYQDCLSHLDRLQSGISAGWGEREIQRFLKTHKYLLMGRHRTGHGTYVFYESQLGSQHKMDWAIANGSSGGLLWEVIELESPKVSPFTKKGELSKYSQHGLNQIHDWRRWLMDNRDYAQRSCKQNGLGLLDIGDHCEGVVVVGRRINYEKRAGWERYNKDRVRVRKESHIEIISYESFLESLRFRFQASLRGGSGKIRRK